MSSGFEGTGTRQRKRTKASPLLQGDHSDPIGPEYSAHLQDGRGKCGGEGMYSHLYRLRRLVGFLMRCQWKENVARRMLDSVLQAFEDDSSQDSRSVNVDEDERKSQMEGPLCVLV